MERKAWLFASLLVAGLFVACGGSGDKSCTASSDCDPGTVCQDTKCQERLCNGTGDCSGDDICVPGALVGKDPNFRYCTAVQCKTDGTLPCTGVGQVCQNGLCVTDTPPTDVIEDNGTDEGPRPDVPVEDTPGTDVTIVEENCKSCENDDGCSPGYKCLPVGSTRYCLRECEDGGDCPGGYLCYASSSVLKNCLPATYSCVACAFDTPCEEGKCCDFGTGECKECRTECQACTYDFDCAAGMRCYKKQGNPNGVCVEECKDGTCTDAANFTCGANASGVMVCQPNDDDACGGCAVGTYPKPDGTGCVECLNSSHCDSAAGEVCNLTTNVCEGGDCPGGFKCDDDQCHQCCEDADCSNVPNATGTCTNYVCDGAAPCNGACTGQYPVCATINGIEQCVQCKVDADCQGIDSTCTCTGEPLYSCTFPDGSVCMTEGGICAAPCLSDAECPPGTNGEQLSCHLTTASSGICYNPSGSCDQATMCCGAGQTCFDIMSILFGGLGGGMPGMPGGAMPTMFGYCSCDSQHPCLGGGACTPTAMVCIIPMISDIVCAGGALPAGMPENLCIDLASLLGGLI